MGEWKRSLLVGIGWGLATAVGLAILAGMLLWYEGRPRPPKPPKPQNAAAIKAEYDYVETEGEKNTIAFYYTLENTTDFDYRVEDDKNILMSSELEEEKSLFSSSEYVRIDYPIIIPAKKRMRFVIHLEYPYPGKKEKEGATLEERRKYRAGIEKFISDELGNLDGFDLLDDANRYEIIFPSGWKHAKP